MTRHSGILLTATLAVLAGCRDHPLTPDPAALDLDEEPVLATAAGACDPAGAPSPTLETATGPAVVVRWTDCWSNERFFRVKRYRLEGGQQIEKALHDADPNVVAYRDTTVEAGKTYRYLMRVRLPSGFSDWSPAQDVTVPPPVDCDVDGPPVFRVAAKGPPVVLEWEDCWSNERFFRVKRYPLVNGNEGPKEIFDQRRLSGVGQTGRFTDTTAQPGKTYRYLMRVRLPSGFSDWSPAQDVTVPPPGGCDVHVPPELRLVSAGPPVVLAWKDLWDNERFFRLKRYTLVNGQWGERKIVNLPPIPGRCGAGQYTDDTAQPGKTYRYLMRVRLPDGWGGWSPPIDVTVPTGFPILLAAGDISGRKYKKDSRGGREHLTQARITQLLKGREGAVAALGDLVIEDGRLSNYTTAFDATWGAFKDRIRPALGNHDTYRDVPNPATPKGYDRFYYATGCKTNPDGTFDPVGLPNCKDDSALPFYDYWGTVGGLDPDRNGYYAYWLGTGKGRWRVIALNSNVRVRSRSAQYRWLLDELQANPAACTVAYYHHPRWAEGRHEGDASNSTIGDYPELKLIWNTLFDHGVDVVLNGHEHRYQVYKSRGKNGQKVNRGMTQFIVGTGGNYFPAASKFSQKTRGAPLDVEIAERHGVLELELKAGSYEWRFHAVDGTGADIPDRGSATCR